MQAVTPQLYGQDKLSEEFTLQERKGTHGTTLRRPINQQSQTDGLVMVLDPDGSRKTVAENGESWCLLDTPKLATSLWAYWLPARDQCCQPLHDLDDAEGRAATF